MSHITLHLATEIIPITEHTEIDYNIYVEKIHESLLGFALSVFDDKKIVRIKNNDKIYIIQVSNIICIKSEEI